MRDELRDPARLEHILMAIDNIFSFIGDRKPDNLKSELMLYFAVVKNLEIIGEAAYKLTHGFIDAHPLTPWRKIIGMRHLLVHGYYSIDPEEVWNVCETDLEPLRTQIRSYLAEYTD